MNNKHYVCQVLTKEFKEQVLKFLSLRAGQTITHTSQTSLTTRIYGLLKLYWRGTTQGTVGLLDIPANLKTPQFSIHITPAMEHGYQTKPRIQWGKDVLKVEDIEDIIGYTISYTEGTEPLIA